MFIAILYYLKHNLQFILGGGEKRVKKRGGGSYIKIMHLDKDSPTETRPKMNKKNTCLQLLVVNMQH